MVLIVRWKQKHYVSHRCCCRRFGGGRCPTKRCWRWCNVQGCSCTLRPRTAVKKWQLKFILLLYDLNEWTTWDEHISFGWFGIVGRMHSMYLLRALRTTLVSPSAHLGLRSLHHNLPCCNPLKDLMTMIPIYNKLYLAFLAFSFSHLHLRCWNGVLDILRTSGAWRTKLCLRIFPFLTMASINRRFWSSDIQASSAKEWQKRVVHTAESNGILQNDVLRLV